MNPLSPDGLPVVIGLLGGVAAGKSTVAKMLSRHGMTVLDADFEARAVTQDPVILARIGARFGAGLVAGGLDRAGLAKLVFADPVARKDLEAITHPAVRARLEAGLEQARAAGCDAVLDVPLLLEGGLIEVCDVCIFLEVSPDERRRRAIERGWGAEELARREAAQASLSDKRARCRFVIRTDGDRAATAAQVAAVLAELAADL